MVYHRQVHVPVRWDLSPMFLRWHGKFRRLPHWSLDQLSFRLYDLASTMLHALVLSEGAWLLPFSLSSFPCHHLLCRPLSCKIMCSSYIIHSVSFPSLEFSFLSEQTPYVVWPSKIPLSVHGDSTPFLRWLYLAYLCIYTAVYILFSRGCTLDGRLMLGGNAYICSLKNHRRRTSL